MDSLTGLQVFVKAADGGSFSEAARQMGVTPSAVSKAIKQIETRIGVALFQRTSRNMMLTDVGRAYHESCKRILNDLDDATEAAAGARSETSGRVHLDTPIAFGRLHVLPQLASFRARYPKVSLDITLNDRVVDLVDEGVDIGIRVGHLPDSRLIARKLCDQTMAICAAPSYLEWKGEPTSVEDLSKFNCLLFRRPQYGRHVPWFIASDGADPLLLHPSGDFSTNNAEALRDAAIVGLGVVQLPRYIVDAALADGRLREVLSGVSADAEPIWIVTRQIGPQLPKVKVTSDFLKEIVGTTPSWELSRS